MNGRAGRPSVLFICGSINQTTQMHQIASALPEVDATFTPYYGDRSVELLAEFGLLEGTIAGSKLRGRCLDYLRRHDLVIDAFGRRGGYDLVLTCSDVVIPSNVRGVPLVAVQEGILDPDGFGYRIVRRFARAPRWLAGTAATGLSGSYERFCVASHGYRDLFIGRGAPAERVVVTGIPNFDDCEAFRRNSFPRRGYVLVCSSDTRETFKWTNRERFFRQARHVAKGRPTLVKLHPNENVARSTRDVARWFPEAEVVASGDTNAMIANCDVLVTLFSSCAFVGLALGKEVHSFYPLRELERLLPEQNASAARNIAAVCREVLARYGWASVARGGVAA